MDSKARIAKEIFNGDYNVLLAKYGECFDWTSEQLNYCDADECDDNSREAI